MDLSIVKMQWRLLKQKKEVEESLNSLEISSVEKKSSLYQEKFERLTRTLIAIEAHLSDIENLKRV